MFLLYETIIDRFIRSFLLLNKNHRRRFFSERYAENELQCEAACRTIRILLKLRVVLIRHYRYTVEKHTFYNRH